MAVQQQEATGNEGSKNYNPLIEDTFNTSTPNQLGTEEMRLEVRLKHGKVGRW